MGGLPRTPRHLDFITDPTSLEVQRVYACRHLHSRGVHIHSACYMPDKVSMLKELTPGKGQLQVSALIKGGLRSNCEGVNNM